MSEDMRHLIAARDAAIATLQLAQRRRPRDVAGAPSNNAAQIDRLQAAVDRLNQKIKGSAA